MRSWMFRTAVLVVSLLLVAVLPVVAENAGRAVAASEELAAFLSERGIDPKYVGKAQSEVPADQWKLLVKLVNTADDEDDHEELNSLVFSTLCCATEGDGDPVYITIGNHTWCHECGVD